MDKPVKIYATYLEQEAEQQFNAAMDHPYALQGALMPDAHSGYSLPIGGVVLMQDHVVPAWVGYDIGCGVLAAKLSLLTKKDIIGNAGDIFNEIYRQIPVGFNHRQNIATRFLTSAHSETFNRIYGEKNGDSQIGTLGGGNHFIEIGFDTDENIWIIIHSGSRGVGHGIASYYMDIAEDYGIGDVGHRALHIGSHYGASYIEDMNASLDYALMNRKTILYYVLKALDIILPDRYAKSYDFLINKNHNHAEHVGNNKWIHRKGATQSNLGEFGVIPGNMRDGSFIVMGKGNEDSLCSSSHGAGRVFSRREAKRSISIDIFTSQMEGIVAKVEESTLDESPNSYKNIFWVMEDQADLVEVITYVKPLINIKA